MRSWFRHQAPPGHRFRLGALAGVLLLVAILATSAFAALTDKPASTLADRYSELLADERASSGDALTLEQERDLLYRAYESLLPAEPTTIRDLNEEFEALFAQLGPVASPDPSKLDDSKSGATAEGELGRGIIDDGENLPGFEVSNAWVGVVGSRDVTVFAGAWLVTPRQGDLVIFVDGEPREFKGDLPSSNAGPLSIAGVDGPVLSIVDESGSEYVLDVESLPI